MKIKTLFKSCAILALTLFGTIGFAQCPNNNVPYGSVSGLVGGQSATVFCMYGGEYATVQVENGATYTFSTCGGGAWDSQLTLYSSTGNFLAYNDDFCGLQSEVVWTATFTGTVRALVDRYFCTSQNSCMDLKVTRSNTNQINPCDEKVLAQCGVDYSYSLNSGSGSWDPSGPYATPGNEQVYEFTPLIGGLYTINLTHSNSGWVDLFIQANSCGASGWTYVDDVFSSATNFITLNAGTTYYFLLDDENTSSSTGIISIDCPSPAVDPCSSITAIECGLPETYNLSGSGSWNPPGPWGTPGEESVYSFTPAVSGDYDVIVNNSGFYVDLFYKSSSCGETGWTYLDDIFSSATNSLFLTSGTTYYFLIDDENISQSSGSILIDCPCIGNQVDETYSLTGNQVFYGSTLGACDDCGLRPSEDITYEINIPCPGTYTFETCNLANWDTYIYLSSSPCSGVLSSNDDNCSLRSSLTYSFANAGAYYITIEGFSAASAGDFGISVSKTCDLTLDLLSPDKGCGFNLSCSNSDDGEITMISNGACGNLDYLWSNGATNASITGLSEGAYSLSITDQWGCAASSDITLTAPPEITVAAGQDQTVYFGYQPLSCAELNGAASGGCGSLTFEWLENGNVIGNSTMANVCPSTATVYDLVVTDDNGCQNSDDVNVCVVDVICYAGNSNVQKVEMCQIPPGNPNNAHTICVNANSVQAHLNNGSQLGACGEAFQSCNIVSGNSNSQAMPSNVLSVLDLVELDVFPNPFDDALNITVTSSDQGFYQVDIIDVNGKVVQELYSGSSEGLNQRFEVNGGSISSGLYLVKVTLDGSSLIQKRIIKQ